GEPSAPCNGDDDCPAWVQVAGSLPPTYMFAIAAAPNAVGVVYAGNYSGGGVFKTTSSGESWSSASAGLPDGAVHSLAVDPFDAEHAWVGTPSGLYVSINGGARWTKLDVDDGLTDTFLIVPDPQVKDRIYVGVGTELQKQPAGYAVYSSQDGGLSWTLLPTLPKDRRPSSISVDAGDSSHLFVGVYNVGMFESLDAGSSFHAVANLPATTYQIVAKPSANLLCGLTSSGLSRSTDGGQSWTVKPPIGEGSITLAPSGVFFAVGFVGVYRSEDCDTWTRVDAHSGYTAVLDAAGAVYVPTTGEGTGFQGVRRSPDGVSAFANVNSGLANGDVTGIAIDASVPDGLFVTASYQGVYHSTDGAGSFAAATGNIGHTGTSGFPDTLFYDGHTLLAYSAMIVGRLFRSDDTGQNWSSTLLTLPDDRYAFFSALLPSPDFASDQTIYLGTFTNQGAPSTLARSTDGGTTISPLGQGDFNTRYMIWDKTHAGWLWAIGAKAGEPFGGSHESMYLSQDAGLTWTQQPLLAQGRYRALAAATTPTGEVLYAAADSQGLSRSDDAGNSWVLVGKPPGDAVQAFAIDPQQPSTLYLASGPDFQLTAVGERGLYKSRDGGATWSHADRGMLPGVVKSLVINPANPSILYAGMVSGGLYKTTSGGE
ncbi:MAG TPA: hypothetical protein VNG33_15625, partial [Polyangiaceae bacterium]|nr:hypothetical protein [Polyangiaceae bacterium]